MVICRMAIESSSRPFLSIIIPVHNSSATIGTCLKALFQSTYTDFEAIVVDDRSTDGSADIIRQHPCTLVTITGVGGASVARNRGAAAARGDVLFFIDSDCVVLADTLEKAADAFHRSPDAVTGGTYTPKPYDQGLFSLFQSVFINYSESKRTTPDYVATHAMVINRSIFVESGGFNEDFMPILEDVEFSHRLRRRGVRLLMAPEVMVRHIFHFTMGKSFRNAFKKTRYWIRYSMENKDLGTDSGTASVELKANGMAWLASALLIIAAIVTGSLWPMTAVALIQAANLMVNIKFLGALRRAGTPLLALGAIMYYLFFYSAPIWAGTAVALLDVWSGKGTALRETT
jgi:GT2 family glycosyltransferase